VRKKPLPEIARKPPHLKATWDSLASPQNPKSYVSYEFQAQ